LIEYYKSRLNLYGNPSIFLISCVPQRIVGDIVVKALPCFSVRGGG